ncbi:MAG TPA: GNAT family N-acetyltransferase [Puia sp.]|nr:GNAT family N-acetyltransferase [Puia sp.]
MEISTVTDNPERQQFQLTVDGETASIEYRLHEGKLVLMHTEVPEKLGGRGIGSALADFAFRYARSKRLPVKVYCPFVQAWQKKHPEYDDLVVKAD